MEVVNQDVSKELAFNIKFEDGKAIVEVGYEGKGGGVTVIGTLNAEYFLDLLADAIPGQLDNAVIFALKAAI